MLKYQYYVNVNVNGNVHVRVFVVNYMSKPGRDVVGTDTIERSGDFLENSLGDIFPVISPLFLVASHRIASPASFLFVLIHVRDS